MRTSHKMNPYVHAPCMFHPAPKPHTTVCRTTTDEDIKLIICDDTPCRYFHSHVAQEENSEPLEPSLRDRRPQAHEQRLKALREPIRVYTDSDAPAPLLDHVVQRAKSAQESIRDELRADIAAGRVVNIGEIDSAL